MAGRKISGLMDKTRNDFHLRSEEDIIAEELRTEWPDGSVGYPAAEKMWGFKASHSIRAGGALLMGVYGREVQTPELIARALSDQLTAAEIADLETRRPVGHAERFGPGGPFGIRVSGVQVELVA